jgi:NAD(P)-dependent dehydrogenase (short-subunit alcohol dehydrogenase family)
MPTNRFANRIALVTGASRGIGRAVALAFAAEGCAVALLGTGAEGIHAVADEIIRSGGRALPLVGDVSQEQDVNRCVAKAENDLGPVDILVSNAGIPGPTAAMTEISAEDFEKVLRVNLLGPFLSARAVLQFMIPRAREEKDSRRTRGCIIHMGSIAGKISYPQRTPYASSKWGLIGLTMTLAEEVGRFGIRVNCICPGPVQTELLEDVILARAKLTGMPVEAVRQKFMALTMLKRIVSPEDVAALVLFLASEAADSITGQAIDITGGLAQFPG